MTDVRPRPAVAFASVLLLAQGLLGASCVDGKTPDCSDPSVQCGPPIDGSSGDGATDAPPEAEASTTVDASSWDADADAPADAPDAG